MKRLAVLAIVVLAWASASWAPVGSVQGLLHPHAGGDVNYYKFMYLQAKYRVLQDSITEFNKKIAHADSVIARSENGKKVVALSPDGETVVRTTDREGRLLFDKWTNARKAMNAKVKAFRAAMEECVKTIRDDYKLTEEEAVRKLNTGL